MGKDMSAFGHSSKQPHQRRPRTPRTLLQHLSNPIPNHCFQSLSTSSFPTSSFPTSSLPSSEIPSTALLPPSSPFLRPGRRVCGRRRAAASRRQAAGAPRGRPARGARGGARYRRPRAPIL
eukprot:338953-Pleurochrysis_carterae.AAC.5